MKKIQYSLELAVFICGAVVMIFELVWSRVLGPYFGTSIFIWTSLIGIILGSLSLWYYLWGKLSDKKADYKGLSQIIFIAALFIGFTIIIKDNLLDFLITNSLWIRSASIIASIILFSPTSIALGMVSPYAAKIKIQKIENSGTTIGNLYALSTLWSIVGTFLSGFFLIPHFGTNKLLIILSITLIIISLVLSVKEMKIFKILSIFFLICWIFIYDAINLYNLERWFADLDTNYNRVWIQHYEDRENRAIRSLLINNEHSSAMFLDSNELVYEYTKYYHLASHFFPDFKKTLMLWGAWYSYPKNFLEKYPYASIDVVEIDPGITKVAKTYFNLKENPRLKIYHEDARVFLNKNTQKYDVIFWDAFNSHYSLPYQLTTQEAVKRKFESLNEKWWVILNIISSIEGESGEFLRAEYKTYKSIFPQVYLFPIRTKSAYEVQNIILIALKSDEKISFESNNSEINTYLEKIWTEKISDDIPILKDDYAPVEYYINKTI